MSIKTSIARTIRRLNLHGFIMALPVFGQALYEALSCELDRVNDYRNIVKTSAVPNDNMDADTIEDYEKKYGIENIYTSTDDEKIARIIESAQRDGNGGPDWIQEQLQQAGFPLYVIINEKDVSVVPQFGNHQFGNIQFGGTITYTDPRGVDGELVASSPNGNIGPQYINFGTFQFGNQQFGVLQPNTANPRPKPFTITSEANKWGYFFFLSPFPDKLAGPTELLQISDLEWRYLEKLVMQLKHLRNWAIVQIEIV